MKSNYGCPVKATANALAGKWKVLILWHLSFGPIRFAEIRDLLPGVSEKVLTEQLRQLEADGLILRRTTGTQPARVDYRLSSAGEEIVPVMQAMCDWATKFLGAVPHLPRTRQQNPAVQVHVETNKAGRGADRPVEA